MSSAPSPVKVATAAAGLILLTAGVWVLCGYVWPTLSNVEVATLQAMLDPRLFRGDFAVQEALQFTPRFYYNELIFWLARTGLPLAGVFATWHLVALAVLLASVRSLARNLGVGAAAAAVLLMWLLSVRIGTVGLTFFYQNAPVPGVWAVAAVAAVAAGAACAARERTVAAYACFGGAALLQFLVGFYAGVLALPLLLRATGKQRLLALGLWVLGLALVYGPMRLAGGTGAGVLDNATFVETYAQLRLPHHLVPSTWGWPVWIQFAAFYAGAGWFLHRTASGRPAFERPVLYTTLGLTALALTLNYVFVEVYPLALVAKLQPARITPLAQAVILVLLASRIQAGVARKDWLGAALLALIPLTLFPGLLLVLAAILTPPAGAPAKVSWRTLILAAAVLLAFQPLEASMSTRILRYGLCGAFFLLPLIPAWLERRPWTLMLVATLAISGAAACAWGSCQPDWPRFLMGYFAVDARPFDAPGIIGQRFGGQSHPDAIILLPPGGDSWSFKLFARRAAVVDGKNTPFTDRGLREWKQRMDAVLGTPYTRGLDLEAAWRARTPEELRRVAEHYHARYILTRDAWHPQLPGRRIDQEQGWSLWQLH